MESFMPLIPIKQYPTTPALTAENKENHNQIRKNQIE